MNVRPSVSAIILNYRSPQDAVRCVDSLLKQTIRDIEILIVDNHSEDESIGMLRARFGDRPSVRFIETRANGGYSRGNNFAASFATGTYLLFLNPDNVFPPDALERMLAVFALHPEAGIVGPALVYPGGAIRPSARRFPTVSELFLKRVFPKRWHEEYRSSLQNAQSSPESWQLKAESYEVDWLVGACLMIPRALFEELHGFDERFFLFFEDIDLCRRCWQHGRKVLYVPGICVADRRRRLSDGGALSLLLKPIGRIHIASALKYFLKWGFLTEHNQAR